MARHSLLGLITPRLPAGCFGTPVVNERIRCEMRNRIHRGGVGHCCRSTDYPSLDDPIHGWDCSPLVASSWLLVDLGAPTYIKVHGGWMFLYGAVD
jgi:hypothetical protein